MNVTEKALRKQISYWKDELAGVPGLLELPTDKPRPVVQSFRISTEIFDLSQELLKRLESLARREHVTLAVILEATFSLLLHRYTAQDDILVGTTIADCKSREVSKNGKNGRVHDSASNTVVLRTRFTDDLTFRSLLQQVRDRIQDAYAHADVPFEQLFDELGLEKDINRSALFQVMFNFGNAKETSVAPEPWSPDTDLSTCDLALYILETGNSLHGSIEYSTDLFEADTIRRMCEHYRVLLEAIFSDPGQSISKLPILSQQEQTLILYEWNATQSEYPAACVHELFEWRVESQPDAIAIVFGEQRLSYRELNQRANQVAHYLRKRGVRPEILVGVSLERSPEMVIGLLGVWKAGGAYVPLDPTYPQERLSFMVSDSDVRVLLTESKSRHLFPNAKDKTVCLDSDWPAIAGETVSNPVPLATPADLAYVMYTSGSTGNPKGAMILHSGLVNYLWWAMNAYGVEAGSSVPVHSSISFDLTVTSLYPALLAGGQVELLREDVGAQNLITALKKAANHSLVKITPAHLDLLSQQIHPAEAVGVTKTFVIGGEALLAENLTLWREFAPLTRLINEYGPTETVVGCCVYEVRPEDPRTGPALIGRPIANTQLYILDGNMQPVPIGVKGNLYIGGAGVARGYLNRPDLTHEKFIDDPFSGKSGARLYKSGDLARYRKDGTLEYLGRVDDQVKVRGYRIELGEIEAALAGHPDVQSCTVLALEGALGDKQLVAYTIARGNESPAAEALKDFLKQTLPEYMVPAQFVFLKSFPLTHNGKIDRKALPAPTHGDVSATHEFIAPRTETEKKLAAMWIDLLKVERIGIHDDFFDLGGHSLMAIKALSRIRDAFDVDLPLATLLEAPTIARLAALLRKEAFTPPWSLLVPIRAAGSKPPLFLMHAHGGNVLDYHPLVNHLESDQPVYAFQARGLDGKLIKDPTLEEMAAAYVAELRSFQPEGPYFLGGFCLGGLLALEAAIQLSAAGQKVAFVMMIQSIHPEAMNFTPHTSVFMRLWYRFQKRVSLESENLSHGQKGYVADKIRNLWDVVRVRAAIARGVQPKSSELSKLFYFEALGVEHKKAMDKYRPAPYDGDVLVFRGSKQLAGLVADKHLGWDRTVRSNLQVCEVPGHQQNLLLEPNVSQLAKEVSIRLKTAQRKFCEEVKSRQVRAYA
jgi:amino acid adenylation domain-containing protein